jgi:acetoin utilization protein AcuB
MTTVRDLMTGTPATVRSDSTVRDAARLLATMSVRHLPVVDRNGRLVGMISDRDLHGVTIPRFASPEHAGEHRAALGASIATIMSSEVVSVGEEATLEHVVGLMLENKIGAVPVVNRSGGVVGIVSYVDVLHRLPLPPG